VDAGAASISTRTNPIVTSIAPTSGSTKGSTLVTVTGVHILKGGNVEVWFGSKLATISSWSEGNVIVSTAPGTGKDYIVCVKIDGRGCVQDGQQQAQWSYDPPKIADVSTLTGSKPTTGGTIVISGDNFGDDAAVISVSIDNTRVCANPQIVNGQIICVLPGGTGTDHPLTVTVNSQQSTTKYAYDAPVVYAIQPTTGHLHGNELLVLLGRNFGNDSSSITVTIGTYTCNNITLITPDLSTQNSSLLSCITPQVHAASKLNVAVKVVEQTSDSTVTFNIINDDNGGGGGGGGGNGSLMKQPWWAYLIFATILVVFFAIGFAVHLGISRSKKIEYTAIN